MHFFGLAKCDKLMRSEYAPTFESRYGSLQCFRRRTVFSSNAMTAPSPSLSLLSTADTTSARVVECRPVVITTPCHHLVPVAVDELAGEPAHLRSEPRAVDDVVEHGARVGVDALCGADLVEEAGACTRCATANIKGAAPKDGSKSFRFSYAYSLLLGRGLLLGTPGLADSEPLLLETRVQKRYLGGNDLDEPHRLGHVAQRLQRDAARLRLGFVLAR